MSIKITPQIEKMARTLCGEKEKTCSKCDSFNLCEFWIEASTLHNAGYRKQAWISVDERLPDRAGAYLVSAKGSILICNCCDYWFDGNLSFDNYNVTHWMPLPEPPKGE